MRAKLRPLSAADIALVALFVAAEIGTLLDPPTGSKAALFLFPAAWTLPLLFRRRWPVAASLTVIAALALEGQVAYDGTEVLWSLPPVIVAFFTIGRRVERSRAAVAWALGLLLGGILVAADAGPITASSIAFLLIVSVAPGAAGAALRARTEEAQESDRRAELLEQENETRAQAAVAEERARIARELHDMIGHAISVITVQAGAARMQLDGDPGRAREPLIAIEETGQEALAEMRRLIGMLRDMGEPGLAPQPGIHQLDRLVQGVRDSGLAVDLCRRGHPTGPLPPDVDLAAYRIVQEALTNALKHGSEGATTVTVGYSLHSLRLEIESSGVERRNGSHGGRGLVGMRERVELCGGELEVGDVGGGYAVRATLPLT